MARLRNERGQFISKYAEEGIRQIAQEKNVKDVQSFYLQNTEELQGLFSPTNEAKFSTENGGYYISTYFDKFAVNNGEKVYNISRNEALKLIAQFNNFINKEGSNFAVFTGEMKDKDRSGSFHKLEINLPVTKNKGKGFRMSKENLDKMEKDGILEYYKKSKKK